MRKYLMAAASAAMLLSLSGCGVFSVDNGLLSFTTSAQTKMADVLSQGDTDLALASKLAASDTLNVPAAAQCLPVFKDWYDTLSTQLKASAAAGNAGVASTAVKVAWAKATIDAGVPSKVQLACGTFASQLDTDVTDVVGLVTKLVK